MATVCAFDLSLTGSGFALGVDGKIAKSGVILPKGDGLPRMLQIRNKVMAMVDEAKPCLVVMEDFSYASRDGKAFERVGVAYMIRAELHTDGVPYVVCSPMGLKKFCCGTAGSAKAPIRKEHILKEVFRRFNHDVSDNNQADALVLAYVAMALIGDWTPTMEAQSAVMQKIRENSPSVKEIQSRFYAGDEW